MGLSTLREWLGRAWGALRRQRGDMDLEQELRLHLELAAEDARRRGHPESDVPRIAAVRSGGTSQAMDALRDQRGLPWLDDFARDVLHSVRGFVRAPAFTLTAVLTLAVGIGANTAIFSLIDAVILRPLPVSHPHELVILTNPAIGGAAGGLRLGERDHVTFSEFETLRERMTSFSGMFGAAGYTATFSGMVNGQAAEELKAKMVTNEYFTMLGVPAVAGRTFVAGVDDGPGSSPYAVISHAYWQRRFGGSASALGARLRIADANLTIIGVAPQGFLGESVGEPPDLWIPAVMQPQLMPGMNWVRRGNIMWLHAFGRLKPGVTLAAAQAEANVVFAQMLQELSRRLNPRIAQDVLQQHMTLRDASRGASTLRGNYTMPLYILMGLVALVLTIACTSVATLLLARAGARRKEFDIRLAVGAGRFRLMRQLLTESLVLSIIAGLLGGVLAFLGVRLLVATVLGSNDQGQGITLAELGIQPDVRVLLFTGCVCLLTVLVFGVAPAWRAVRATPLRSLSRPMLFRVARGKVGHSLVVWQVALSVVLLIGAGWFLRTLRNLDSVDLGYPRQIAQMMVRMPVSRNAQEAAAITFDEVRDRLATLPGVRAVTYSQTGLLGDNYLPIRIEGFRASSPADTLVKIVQIGPDYFSGIGIPMLRGRGIERRDVAGGPPVCVVNQAFATFFFGETDPIGRFVIAGDTQWEIVGVSRDARDTMTYPLSFAANLRQGAARTFYPAAAQRDADGAFESATFQLMTSDDPAAVLSAARAAVPSIHPALTVGTSETLDAQVNRLTSQERTIAQLATVIGSVALSLACIGLYGLLSHLVTQRTNDIGIRLALGAKRHEIIALVLRELGVLVALGILIGIPVSLGAAGLVRSQLFGLTPTDLPTLAGVLALVCIVAAIAGYVPARRAANINPLVAIRTE